MKFVHLIGIIFGLLLLVAFGILHSIWFVLGLVVYIVVWVYVLKQFPDEKDAGKRRVVNILFIGIIASVIGIDVYNLLVVNFNLSSESFVRRTSYEDLRFARSINPQMLKANRAIYGFNQHIDDEQGVRLNAALIKIKNDYDGGGIDASTAMHRRDSVLNFYYPNVPKTRKTGPTETVVTYPLVTTHWTTVPIPSMCNYGFGLTGPVDIRAYRYQGSQTVFDTLYSDIKPEYRFADGKWSHYCKYEVRSENGTDTLYLRYHYN